MSISRLQDRFMKEIAEAFQATQARIVKRLAKCQSIEVNAIIEDELRGLYHGVFVMFDGGTALADDGLVSLFDEDGVAFERHLHEICFKYWPNHNTR